MCDVPKRRVRAYLRPARIVIAALALAIVASGWLIPNPLGLLPIGVGCGVFLVAILLPAVREVELGFPSGVRVVAGLNNRTEAFRSEFESEQGDLDLCTQLLCDDPELASRLLKSAWAKTAASWRGPITAQTRVYTLCVFVQLLRSQRKWVAGSTRAPTAASGGSGTAAGRLAALEDGDRTVVVLHEFAELPLASIAAITGTSSAEARAALSRAEASVGNQDVGRGGP